MRLGMIGLGRMGMNMARRLLAGGVEVVAYNRSPDKVAEVAKAGAIPALSLEELVAALAPPRVVWLMLPAGAAVDEHLARLKGLLSAGDVVVDGGNSHFKDDARRAEELGRAGIDYLDAGVSGGVWGLQVGYCTMIGGDRRAYETLMPALDALAPKGGYLHCGGPGAGHFVKMIHNGIEYGMMQAYAEGLALIKASDYGPSLDLAQVCDLWNQGSVIRSWLLELCTLALAQDPDLSGLAPYVEDSGEGRWTVAHAVESGVSAPVLTLSLMERFRSRDSNSFADRVLAALRREFGGHAVTRAPAPGSTGEES